MNDVKAVCENLSNMAELVDAALVYTVNWDFHVERVAPLIKNGKPVFIYKNIVGSLHDINGLLNLGAQYKTPTRVRRLGMHANLLN